QRAHRDADRGLAGFVDDGATHDAVLPHADLQVADALALIELERMAEAARPHLTDRAVEVAGRGDVDDEVGLRQVVQHELAVRARDEPHGPVRARRRLERRDGNPRRHAHDGFGYRLTGAAVHDLPEHETVALLWRRRLPAARSARRGLAARILIDQPS